MSDVLSLKAVSRARAGKGASRAVRRDGQIPAVIYGDRKAAELIAVNENELKKLIKTGHFLTAIIELDMDGTVHRTLTRDLQLHPVTERVIHIDFLRIGADTKAKVMVPVHFRNDTASPGIKRGGVLNVVRYEVEIECPVDTIPDELVVDLTGLEIGASIRISSIALPEGARPVIRGRDFVIATIASPTVKTEEAADAPAA
jgi:large subunit ribosomal protein L25